MSEIKVHRVKVQIGRWVRFRCGREAWECDGFKPSPGHPGEYDTATCDRLHGTIYEADVTCKKCLR